MHRSLVLLASCAFVAACGTPASPPVATERPQDSTSAPSAPTRPTPPTAPTAPTAPVAAHAWSDAERVESNAGGFVVRYRTSPAPIPSNDEFALEAWVFERGGELPLRDVELAVDAGMPEHGHGMNREPRIERRDDGSFAARGLLFHMSGRWELYFDVTRGALSERAQVDVELE